MFTNGKDSGSNTQIWVTDPATYINDLSIYNISISGTQLGNSVDFSVEAGALILSNEDKDLRLFVSTVMGKVIYPSSLNGLYEHFNAAIDLLTTNTGKPISFSSVTNHYQEFAWTIPDYWITNRLISWKAENLKVIAWLQDYETKEILQVTEFNFK